MLSCALLTGCGAAATAPATQHIVFKDDEVVSAAPDRSESQGRKAGQWVLPPLPMPLQEASSTFQKGWRRAAEVLQSTGPAYPEQEGAGQEQFDKWLKSDLQAWLDQSTEAVKKAKTPLIEVARGPQGEVVAASTLVGLIDEHFAGLFASVPIPPDLRQDRELSDIYRLELDRTRLPWIQRAIESFVHCAAVANRQPARSYAGWRQFCAEHAVALENQRRDIEVRAAEAELRKKIEAERLRLFGPRPAGPAICWKPRLGKGPEQTVAVVDDGADVGTDAHVDTERDAAAGTAASALSGDAAAGTAAGDAAAGTAASALVAGHGTDGTDAGTDAGNISARDQKYGLVDEKTSIRVSIASDDSQVFDPAHLHEAKARERLARCFAANFDQTQKLTAAVQLKLTVSKKGRVINTEVDAVPRDDAQQPAASLPGRFVRCLRAAVKKIRFQPIAAGGQGELSAVVCLRRTAHENR